MVVKARESFPHHDPRQIKCIIENCPYINASIPVTTLSFRSVNVFDNYPYWTAMFCNKTRPFEGKGPATLDDDTTFRLF